MYITDQTLLSLHCFYTMQKTCMRMMMIRVIQLRMAL